MGLSHFGKRALDTLILHHIQEFMYIREEVFYAGW